MNIVFDLDGTLFQTHTCIIHAVNRFLQELGQEKMDADRILANIGKRSTDFLRSILPSAINANEVYMQYSRIERKEISGNAQLFEGIREMLARLKEEGYRLFVCSNGSEEYIDLVLDKTETRQYFERRISAKFIPKKEILKEFADNNEPVVMIGDTISDFEAGQCNHIPVIGVSYGYGEKQDLKDATYIADNTREIERCIQRIALYYSIVEKIDLSKARVVGINGVDTSGKTTFANQFEKFLQSIGRKAQILHMDDFHNPRQIRRKGPNEIEAYYKNAFNYNQVVCEILSPLKEGKEINTKVICLNLE